MESFSLLKYWRTTSTNSSTTFSRATTPNTILSAASPLSSDDEEEEGPYFDLQFSLQDDNDTDTEPPQNQEQEDQTDSSTECVSLIEEDLKLTLQTNTNINECETEDQNVKISASDELFFKESLVSIEENSNKIPLSLLKSATKFRVLLLKFKKSKSGNAEKAEGKKHSSKFFTVKLNVEEVKAPIVSYFTRDNSSKLPKSQPEDSQDEKINLTKEVVQKYLNMVKPLYVRASKRYAEKLKFSGGRGGGGEGSPPCEVAAEIPMEAEVVTSCVRSNLKQGNNNLQAGLKVVRKHLGKSRSASATVPQVVVPVKVAADRRDDSLLQVQDGIQGAILHCKRSFNGSRDEECSSSSSSVLSRSVSDQSYDKSMMMGTVSSAATSSYPDPGEPKQIIKV